VPLCASQCDILWTSFHPCNLGYSTNIQSTHLCGQNINASFCECQLVENIDVMVWCWVPKVQIDEQPTIIHHNHIVHAIHLFLPIKLILMGRITWKVTNFDEGLVNESNATLHFKSNGVNIHCSSISSHWISLTLKNLMKDAIEFFIQFQMKASYLVTLSCSYIHDKV